MQTQIPKYETYRNGILLLKPAPPPPPGEITGLDRGQNSSILEYGHVAYQIKENEPLWCNG